MYIQKINGKILLHLRIQMCVEIFIIIYQSPSSSFRYRSKEDEMKKKRRVGAIQQE